jgi:hypothetical protein
MSRKNKRQNRAGQNPTAAPGTTTSSSIMGHSKSTFNPDYSYVAKDLRRIGLLAGSFITILVVLSFFLR